MAKITINLSGPDGNVFALMGYGKKLCKQLGRDWEPVQNEMMSGDYENALTVFEREFSDYCRLTNRN